MNSLRCHFLYLILVFHFFSGHAQSAQISGIINHYAAVTAIDTCDGRLTVSDTAGFKPGATVLLIQMQGAEISSANNFLYGIIQNMNYAGRFERSVIDSVGGNTIFLQKRPVYTYDISGKLQVVSLPRYTDVTVTDTLRCMPWNGATGGVLALEATGTLTMSAPVIADGAGFRGGAAYVAPTNNCNFLFPETAFFYAFGNWRGSFKGEGVALPITGKEFGRGPQANGGGGGNDHNSGGGGGGNATDGGNGGNNDEPSTLGCDGYYPGVRGYGIFFTPERMFLGGGGGAGHSNNNLFSKGGNGGGIIVVQAGDIKGATPVFSANGLSAPNADGDGAGGGGGGGTIWLNAGSAPANLSVRAKGGDGGSSLNNNQPRCFGPGGGGSGGRIMTSLFGVNSPAGGKAGIVMNSSNGCNGSSNGATVGDAGIKENLMPIPESNSVYLLPQILAGPVPDTACSGEQVSFSIKTNDGNWVYQWQQNNGSGWQDINGGSFSGYTTDSLVLNGASVAQNGLQVRCLVQLAGCFSIISPAALLKVIPGPSAGFTAAVNAYTADFSNLSAASSYYWSFGDGTFGTATSPQHTYAMEGTYTVTLYAIEPCDTATATQTLIIALSPTAGFFAPDTIIGCQSALVDFENTSSANASAYQWSFPGGSPANSTVKNPSVTYTVPGTYTARLIASNSVGADTSEQTIVVKIVDFPTAGFNFMALPGGVISFNNLSQQATSYTWNFGDGTPTASNFNINHQYAQSGTYTVTLIANNPCGVSILQQNIEVVVTGVATNEQRGLGNIRLFPNPVGEFLVIDCSEASAQPIEIQIFDPAGRLMFSQDKPGKTVTEIGMSGFSAGACLVKIRFDAGSLSRTILKR